MKIQNNRNHLVVIFIKDLRERFLHTSMNLKITRMRKTNKQNKIILNLYYPIKLILSFYEAGRGVAARDRHCKTDWLWVRSPLEFVSSPWGCPGRVRAL